MNCCNNLISINKCDQCLNDSQKKQVLIELLKDMYSEGVTREDIEEMLTGEIESHWHDLRYYTKGEIEDFLNVIVARLEVLEELSFDNYYTKAEIDDIATTIYQTIQDGNDTINERIYNEVAIIESELTGKVDKESGKGLSTNDYTTAEKTKLAGLENYDDTEILEQLSKTIKFDYSLVIPVTNPVSGTIYYKQNPERYAEWVAAGSPTGGVVNIFDEYIYLENENVYEKIGEYEVDLSDYYTKEEIDDLATNAVVKISEIILTDLVTAPLVDRQNIYNAVYTESKPILAFSSTDSEGSYIPISVSVISASRFTLTWVSSESVNVYQYSVTGGIENPIYTLTNSNVYTLSDYYTKTETDSLLDEKVNVADTELVYLLPSMFVNPDEFDEINWDLLGEVYAQYVAGKVLIADNTIVGPISVWAYNTTTGSALVDYTFSRIDDNGVLHNYVVRLIATNFNVDVQYDEYEVGGIDLTDYLVKTGDSMSGDLHMTNGSDIYLDYVADSPSMIVGVDSTGEGHNLVGVQMYQIDDNTRALIDFNQVEVGSESIHLNLNSDTVPTLDMVVSEENPLNSQYINDLEAGKHRVVIDTWLKDEYLNAVQTNATVDAKLEDYYTKDETNQRIEDVIAGDIDLSGYVKTEDLDNILEPFALESQLDFKQNVLQAGNNITISPDAIISSQDTIYDDTALAARVSAAEDDILTKQDILTAGANILIEDNVISSTIIPIGIADSDEVLTRELSGFKANISLVREGSDAVLYGKIIDGSDPEASYELGRVNVSIGAISDAYYDSATNEIVIEFTTSTGTDEIRIPATDLIDTYTGSGYINVDNENDITLNYTQVKDDLLNDGFIENTTLSNYVAKAGSETITGIKTFTNTLYLDNAALIVGNGKTTTSDGLAGIVANPVGILNLQRTSGSIINFYYGTSTAQTSSIQEITEGIINITAPSGLSWNGNPLMTTNTTQDIDGTKTFTVSQNFTNGLVTGVKRTDSDALPGILISGTTGTISTQATIAHGIDFYWGSATSPTARVRETASGTLNITATNLQFNGVALPTTAALANYDTKVKTVGTATSLALGALSNDVTVATISASTAMSYTISTGRLHNVIIRNTGSATATITFPTANSVSYVGATIDIPAENYAEVSLLNASGTIYINAVVQE